MCNVSLHVSIGLHEFICVHSPLSMSLAMGLITTIIIRDIKYMWHKNLNEKLAVTVMIACMHAGGKLIF